MDQAQFSRIAKARIPRRPDRVEGMALGYRDQADGVVAPRSGEGTGHALPYCRQVLFQTLVIHAGKL